MKSRDERYAAADEVARELEAVVASGPAAGRQASGARWRGVALGGVLVAALGTAIALRAPPRSGSGEPDRAATSASASTHDEGAPVTTLLTLPPP